MDEIDATLGVAREAVKATERRCPEIEQVPGSAVTIWPEAVSMIDTEREVFLREQADGHAGHSPDLARVLPDRAVG
jgi:hypothetical protein